MKNSDPRCVSPDACKRKCRQFAVCHPCHQVAKNADPEYRARRGWLTAEQKITITREIANTKRRYVEIGLDWLISESRVRAIARENGLRRQRMGSGE